MNNKLLLSVAMWGFIVLPLTIGAQNITITQLDSTELLTSSRINSYLSITDDQGKSIEEIDTDLIGMFHETPTGMEPAEILNIQRNNISGGDITFLLVLDNSGSMYEEVGDGKAGNRMDHAVRAVDKFLASLDKQNTRVGIAVFNTGYRLLVKPGKDIRAVQDALGRIEKPDAEDAYTELYYSIDRAALDMAGYRGRRSVVLLSDGENYPFFAMSGDLHPDLGDTLYVPDDGLESLKREGVTLYGINFSNEKDKSLSAISVGSGGDVYEAATDSELSGVYDRIRNRIEEEFKVTIRAPLVFMESPAILSVYSGSKGRQIYYAGTLMGSPEKEHFFKALMILLLSFVIWVILMLISFEKPVRHAEISMLDTGRGKALQRTIALSEKMTVIGADQPVRILLLQGYRR